MGQRGVGLRDGAILLWEYIAVWGFQNKNGGIRCHAQILGPLVCAIADKLTRHGTERGKLKPPTSAMGAEVSKAPHTEGDHKFKLNGELLHGGQGKDYTLVHFACDHKDIVGHPAEEPHTGGLGGLQPPLLKTTGGAVHGADTQQMQKENKQRRLQLKRAQTAG